LAGCTVGFVAQTIDLMLRLAFFFRAHSLYREDGVLRPAVAFFSDPHLLPPEVALNGVALGHLVVSEALRKAQA
jgi:hypothetical protein